MNPGILDTPIVIQHIVASRGDMGGQTNTWETYHTCRSKMTTNKGVEKIRAAKDTSVSYTAFKIRYKQGIDTSMQILLDGDTYHIKSINKLGRKHMLELFTEKNRVTMPKATPTNAVAAPDFSVAPVTFTAGTLFIGGGGDLKCTLQEMDEGTYITFKNLADGQDFPRVVTAIHNDSTVTDVIVDQG